jgi:hypothetical protein
MRPAARGLRLQPTAAPRALVVRPPSLGSIPPRACRFHQARADLRGGRQLFRRCVARAAGLVLRRKASFFSRETGGETAMGQRVWLAEATHARGSWFRRGLGAISVADQIAPAAFLPPQSDQHENAHRDDSCDAQNLNNANRREKVRNERPCWLSMSHSRGSAGNE